LLTREEWGEYARKFYKDYKDRPEEEAKEFAYQQGKAFARTIIKKLSLSGNDAKVIAEVLKTVLKFEPTARVETHGDKVHLINEGFCPVMETSLAFSLPWEKMCRIMGWPFFTGLAHAVNPDVVFITPEELKWRLKGDPYCFHVFEIRRE